MKTLGANSIRVYHVDPSADHDGCMSAFSDAGIYAWIDLDTFPTYIIATHPQWNQSQYSAYQKVMDTFQRYDNVAGFFVGNEILTTGANSIAAPYVKAAVRDMKAYRDAKGYRNIPVGYSAADISDLRPNLQNYLACGSNSSEALDFFSLNAYEWCGASTFEQSGYSQLQQNASNYNIPIFFSETGCNTPTYVHLTSRVLSIHNSNTSLCSPRTFDDQAAIFGSQMSDTWSGAIIYEWIQETNDYGLISYGPSAGPTATGAGVVGGFTRTGTPTPISPDFPNLSRHWATLSPSGVAMSAYSPSHSPPACPAFTSGLWEVNGEVALPTLGAQFNGAASSSITSGGGTTATSGGGSSGSGTGSGRSSTPAPTGTASGSRSAGATSASAATSSAAARAIRPFWVHVF